MNFLEQWFGLAPDGGSGLIEATIIVLLVSAVFAIGRRRLGHVGA
jgi:hypothetical protein